MSRVRIGIIGIGNMGRGHAQYLAAGAVEGASLVAVCDTAPQQLAWAEQHLPKEVQRFEIADDLFASESVDGVIIAVPHYYHAPLAIAAFAHGLHVLVEKPAGVYTKQVREMNETAAKSGKVFGIMYNQRTNPLYQKVRDLIQSGELGNIKRMNWIITDWYRSQSYYDSGTWRATWAGEGGGVLLNQDPHQLDLWQWIMGEMPTRVRAFCSFGKYHDIEVEDDVTAYVEYASGATGVFVTSTGEAPGSNRLEFAGDKGKIVIEHGTLTFWRLRTSEREFNKTYRGGFGEPECWRCEVPIHGKETGHKGITQNWVSAILNGTPLLAPGEEGIRGLTLSNAMHLSAWTDDWVTLPIDEHLYWQRLQEKIAESKLKQNQSRTLDVKDSF